MSSSPRSAPKPPGQDEEARGLMAPLIQKGRAQYMRWALTLPKEQMVIGGQSLNIVLRADYVRHADVCLRHVMNNRVSLYILLEDNELAALMCPHGDPGHPAPRR